MEIARGERLNTGVNKVKGIFWGGGVGRQGGWREGGGR